MANKFPNHPHYVPIIKWQAWERRALHETHVNVQPYVLPCIEVRDSKQHVNAMNKLQAFWKAPVLIDYADPKGRLTGVRPIELVLFLKSAIASSLKITPVLSPIDVPALDPELLKLAQSFPELSLRLRVEKLSISPTDLANVGIALKTFGDKPSVRRLIVDLGTTPKTWTTVELTTFAAMLSTLKNMGFHTMHLASGAFPESLQHIKSAAYLDRLDWKLWVALNFAAPDIYLGYSDYGTLSPSWTEKTLTRRGGRSVIRYARDLDWLVLRADGNTTDHSIAISELMVNVYASDFKGRAFSFGDKLISDRADPNTPEKNKHCGHYHITEGWCHHIAKVIKDQY